MDNATWIINNGTSSTAVWPKPPPQRMKITIEETAPGEFVTTGDLSVLFTYFMKSPEIWLRLAALSAKTEDDEDGK